MKIRFRKVRFNYRKACLNYMFECIWKKIAVQRTYLWVNVFKWNLIIKEAVKWNPNSETLTFYPSYPDWVIEASGEVHLSHVTVLICWIKTEMMENTYFEVFHCYIFSCDVLDFSEVSREVLDNRLSFMDGKWWFHQWLQCAVSREFCLCPSPCMLLPPSSSRVAVFRPRVAGQQGILSSFENLRVAVAARLTVDVVGAVLMAMKWEKQLIDPPWMQDPWVSFQTVMWRLHRHQHSRLKQTLR